MVYFAGCQPQAFILYGSHRDLGVLGVGRCCIPGLIFSGRIPDNIEALVGQQVKG
jgi:hypothetical protein